MVELKSMTWPPGKGVSRLPRLGGHPSQIAAFHAYCAAFSNADYDRFSSFYTDDVVLELGSVPPIHGKHGITGFYRDMFSVVRENITVHSVLADDRSIALDATAPLHRADRRARLRRRSAGRRGVHRAARLRPLRTARRPYQPYSCRAGRRGRPAAFLQR